MPWHYHERQVKGGHGPSGFCIATLGEIETPDGKHWLVKARGEEMEVRGRWQGPGNLWFDVEWTFHSDTAGTLSKLATVITRVIVEPGPDGFRVERREPQNNPGILSVNFNRSRF